MNMHEHANQNWTLIYIQMYYFVFVSSTKSFPHSSVGAKHLRNVPEGPAGVINSTSEAWVTIFSANQETAQLATADLLLFVCLFVYLTYTKGHGWILSANQEHHSVVVVILWRWLLPESQARRSGLKTKHPARCHGNCEHLDWFRNTPFDKVQQTACPENIHATNTALSWGAHYLLLYRVVWGGPKLNIPLPWKLWARSDGV